MKKRIFSAVLALTLVLALDARAAQTAGPTAYASNQTVTLDGKPVQFQMYALKDAAGNPTNYVRLRDVAAVLDGTPAQFNVTWSQEDGVGIQPGKPYTTRNGTENQVPFTGDRTYKDGPATTMVDGKKMALQTFVLTDDESGDHTYYKLRDLGEALGFLVDWSDTAGILVYTDPTPGELLGGWRRTQDMAERFNQGFQGNPAMLPYVKVDSLPVTVLYTFRADGTYQVKLDQAAFDAVKETKKEQIKAGMRRYFVEQLAAQDIEVDADTALALSGIDLDKMVDGIFDQAFTGLGEQVAAAGRYLAVGGKLYLTQSEDKAPSLSGEPVLYTVTENSLQLTGPDGTVHLSR